MPEIEQALRNVLPDSQSAAMLKSDIAEMRANMASWFYYNSEPIPNEEKACTTST